MDKVFIKHNDAAHGWLEVSYKDITDLNIQNEISEFSYINKTIESVFLEEDCDMTLFMKAYKNKYKKGIVYCTEDNYEIHPIRNLPNYKSWQFNLYWNPLKGKELSDYLDNQVKLNGDKL
jgi:hypothetical protein